MTVIAYKCPSCGGEMAFDSATGMLACRSCGRKDDVSAIPDPLKHFTFEEGEAREYECGSCGAAIVTDAETAATSCSFCGSSVVLGDRLVGKLAPAAVIPFSIGKQEAIQAFRKWCRNGLLTPSGFMTADRIKSMTGIYVPFWLYDFHNQIEVQAQGTKVRTYVKGDYRYTETQHYQVYRRLRLDLTKVPVDAAEKMNDKLMDKLEPYPYNELKAFKSPYLAGYIAERYSYTDDQLLPRAKDKIGSYIDSYIQASMPGYTAVSVTSKQVDTQVKRSDYVLLPVWVVHYDFNRLEHTFAMNGQTGKVVGKPPISKAKVVGWFAGVFGGTLLSLKLLSLMLGGGFW